MYAITILTTIFAAAPMAVAQIGDLIIPTYPPETGDGYSSTMACFVSVSDILEAPTPTNRFVYGRVMDSSAICSLTLSATLSSGYTEWQSQVTEWAMTIEAKAAKETNCGLEGLFIELQQCPTSHTVFFTEDNEVSSKVYAPLPFPSLVQFPIGAASPKTAVLGVGLALSGFVAIVLAL
jgi:hypothetical protein